MTTQKQIGLVLTLRQVDTHKSQAEAHRTQAHAWEVRGNRRNARSERDRAASCDRLAESELLAYRVARGFAVRP